MKLKILAVCLAPLLLSTPVKAESFQATYPDGSYISQSIPNNSSLTLGQAADLIGKWLEAKQQIFAPPFDQRTLAGLTTSVLYSDTLKAISYLRSNNSYYRYGVQKVESVERFEAFGKKATIEVRVTEDSTLYRDGKVETSSFNTKLVRYSLENWDGEWKIADIQVLY